MLSCDLYMRLSLKMAQTPLVDFCPQINYVGEFQNTSCKRHRPCFAFDNAVIRGREVVAGSKVHAAVLSQREISLWEYLI